MLPESFLMELRDRNDMEDVASSYTTLKHRGNTSVGLCPLHSEKTPSFTVYKDTQSFFCWGCKRGGDVITFIREAENLDYMESVRFLAQRAGLTVPEGQGDDGSARLKLRILELNREAAKFYHEMLKSPSGEQARKYLIARGVDEKTLIRFGMGYAPDSWNATSDFLKKKGFTEEELIASTVAGRSQKSGNLYDQFRNRLIFPIIDIRGNVVAFGGRALGDGTPKYLNSGGSLVFHKSRTLFALNFAKQEREKTLILGEGYMDVVAMHQAGFKNAVATLGTAITPEQSRLMSQYADRVIIAYDADFAGQTAARKAVTLLDEVGVKTTIIDMTGAKDPDEYIKKFGATRFKLLLENSQNATEYEMLKAKERFDMESYDGKSGYLREGVKILAKVDMDTERDLYMGKLAEETGVSRDAIKASVEAQRKKERYKKRKADGRKLYDDTRPKMDAVNPQRSENLSASTAEEQLLGMMLKNPDFISEVEKEITPEDFVTDFNRRVYELIVEGNTDFTLLSAHLEPQQMARLSEISLREKEMNFEISDAKKCAREIKEAKGDLNPEQAGDMSDKELKEYIESLKNRQGKGE